MAGAEGLLADICANPEDDTPRLVYADWLEEHGEPERAEFIRLQIRLAQRPEDDPRYELGQRQDDLLAAHGESWLGPLRQRLEVPVWRRGFVEGGRLTLARFLRQGKQL